MTSCLKGFMNDKRIALGVLTWFLGIIVLVYHHVGVVASKPDPNILPLMESFTYLPWIDWVYLILMTIVGSVLIVSGMFCKPRPRQEHGG